MDFVHDQLATGRSSAYSRSSTRSRASRRCWIRGSPSAAPMMWRSGKVCRGVGYPDDDPRRSGLRVCVPRSRPVGLSAWRHARLLPAWKADRQRIHRSLQRPLPGGMPERALVPQPCRRRGKDGGLAQILQRGTPARGDRPKAADHVAESRWRSQPATVKKPENSTLRRSKEWVSAQARNKLSYERGELGEQVNSSRCGQK